MRYFVAGAFSAFVLGQRFLREVSRKLYERWRRREKNQRLEWTRRLVHDIKNPLFLIQAFTWTYLDKFKENKTASRASWLASQKMAETLQRQSEKILKILKEAEAEESIL